MVGITFSPAADLKAWGEEVGLEADLLCDGNRSVAITYGAAESPDQERPKRISILVGAGGEIRKIYDVSDAEAHANEVLADLS